MAPTPKRAPAPPADSSRRCGWGTSTPEYLRYHDREWGVPVHDDRKLFEFLILEGAQAGLSWITILRKRAAYRRAFDGFDPRKVARYDRRRIDGIWMNGSDVTTVIQRLLGMSYQERANNNCISVERADLVLAGCAILDAIRDAFPLPRLRVADRGLREGMLVEMMREDGALRAC